MKGAIVNKVNQMGVAPDKLILGGVFEFGPGETIFEGEKHSVYVSDFL